MHRLIDGERCADRAAAFEAGQILVWNALPLPQLERLRALPILTDPAMRKLKSAGLLPVSAKRQPWRSWARTDAEAWSLYRDGFQAAATWLNAFVAERFPRYRFTGGMETWRFTETRDMEMHYDIYAARQQDLSLRLFVNVDDVPRTWALGPDLLDFAEPNRGALKGCATLNEINVALTRLLPQTGWPLWRIPPGTAFVVQAQRVAHQVVFGRRLVAFAFHIDGKALADPGLSPAGLTKQIHGHA